MRSKILFIVCIFFSCLLSAQVNFRATLSKNSLGINERVRIDFIIDKDGDNFTPPAFENFRVVGPSQSIKNSWVNGKRSYSKTYTYFLSPMKKGNFKIGQASIKVGDEIYKTMVLNLVVTSAVDKPLNPNDPSYIADKNIHLVAEVSKTNPYLNEPISIVYKLYISPDTGVNNWRELDAPRYADFWSKNINIKNLTVENGTYKGEPYRYVILRKTVLYPQKIGELSIEPLVLDITVQTPSNRRDFFGQIINNTVNKTVSAGKIKVQVKPLPEMGRPNNFSGAVGKFDLFVTTSKKELLLSEAFQLDLEIKGNGNFNLFAFPSINLPQSLEVYEPERSEKLTTNSKGIRGSIKDQYTIVPSSAGKYSIPRISFNYFDPNDSKYKTQTSIQNYINVKGAITNNSRIENNAEDRASNKVDLMQYGNLSFKTKTKFKKINQQVFFYSKIFWIILLLPFTILFIILIIQRILNNKKNDKNWIRANNAKKLGKKYLSDAKKNIDNKTKFYEALDKAMMNYLKSILLFDNSEYNANKVRESLLNKSVSLKTINLLEDILNNCQMARYTPFDTVDMDNDYRRALELITLINNEIK